MNKEIKPEPGDKVDTLEEAVLNAAVDYAGERAFENDTLKYTSLRDAFLAGAKHSAKEIDDLRRDLILANLNLNEAIKIIQSLKK